MPHARLPASKTKRWANCPGETAYLEAHPELEGPSTIYGQVGTCAHALVERCLREGSEPSQYVGRLIEIVDPDGVGGTSILRDGAKWPKGTDRVVFEVDGDMVEAVECMTTYVRHRIFELGLTPDPAELNLQVVDLIKNGTVRLESHVVPLPDRDDTGGTADVIIDAWPVLLEVVDYKHGSGVFVPVEGNEQLRSYTLGALRGPGGRDYERVVYTICQPRHTQSPADGIMSEEVDPAELFKWGEWLYVRAAAVDDARRAVVEGATLEDLHAGGWVSVGEDGAHCTFCSLLGGCPAAMARSQELAATDFDDEPAAIEVPGEEQLPKLLPWMPFLDKWSKAVNAFGERVLMAGREVVGYKVVRGKSNRRWVRQREVDGEMVEVTEEVIVGELVDGFGLDAGDLYTDPKLITGPQAEKLVPKDRRKELNATLLEKPEGKLTMAAEGDRRPAVEVDPAADFDGVED